MFSITCPKWLRRPGRVSGWLPREGVRSWPCFRSESVEQALALSSETTLATENNLRQLIYRRVILPFLLSVAILSTPSIARAVGTIIQVRNKSDEEVTLSDLIVYGPPDAQGKREYHVILYPNDSKDDITIAAKGRKTFFVQTDFEIDAYFVSETDEHDNEVESEVLRVRKKEPKNLVFLNDPRGQPLFLAVDSRLGHSDPPAEGMVLTFVNGLNPQVPGWFVGTNVDFEQGMISGPYTGPARVISNAFEVTVAPSAAPISVMGYNTDVIIDADPSMRFARPFDANTFAWFQSGAMDDQGVRHDDGLPAGQTFAGLSLSAGYLIQPANGNNVLQLGPGQIGSLTFTNPEAYNTLYFIASSGNGSPFSVGNGLINFADGSTQLFNYNTFDWCNGQGNLHPEAVLPGPNGRAFIGPNGTDFFYVRECDFQLYETVIPIDPWHAGIPILSIDFTGAPDAFYSNIFGVSGQ